MVSTFNFSNANPFERLISALKANKALLSPSRSLPTSESERRDYGHGVRLWNDRDPRADQSFFLGSVPGFVLSNDQKIIDWNIAFDMVFGEAEGMKRGMNVGEWYKLIDNFRRLPNREMKLQGEALLPITDRERVVFISPAYGRMVFMKLMSPVLDRITGRVIGWNVALNINSVHDRVKFFEDLYSKIDDQSRHARYIAGAEQLLMRSRSHQEFIQAMIRDIGDADKILIVGAVKAEGLVEALLSDSLHRQVTVVDDDAEALRLVRARCGRFHNRIRLVRRSFLGLQNLPQNRFHAAIIMYPRLSEQDLAFVVETVLAVIPNHGRLLVAGYNAKDEVASWWKRVQSELEQAGDVDTLRWHLKNVSKEDQRLHQKTAVLLDHGLSGAPNWSLIAGARMVHGSSHYLGGVGAIVAVEKAVSASKAI